MGSGKLARSWELTKQAWSILKADKRLLIFPLISGTLVVALMVSTIGGGIAALVTAADAGTGKFNFEAFMEQYGPLVYVGLFLLYFVTYFIITYFQSALLACAMKRLDGDTPTILGGFRAANSRLPQILAWALVNATVGVALQMLQDRVGWIARLFIGAASIVWNIATFFVVPVLVLEGVGPIEAVKRSAGVVKKTWGESLITQVGFAAVMSWIGLLLFLGVAGSGIGLAIALDNPWPVAIMIPLALLSIVLLAIVQSAMKTLLIAATYKFATSGVAAGSFDAQMLQDVFGPKKRR